MHLFNPLHTLKDGNSSLIHWRSKEKRKRSAICENSIFAFKSRLRHGKRNGGAPLLLWGGGQPFDQRKEAGRKTIAANPENLYTGTEKFFRRNHAEEKASDTKGREARALHCPCSSAFHMGMGRRCRWGGDPGSRRSQSGPAFLSGPEHGG